MDNDIKKYHESTSEDLTLYEWFITPHRIDGIPFHDFMMESNSSKGTVFGSEVINHESEKSTSTRFDLANLQIQRYGDTAIASYTILISTNHSLRVKVIAHNESRVIVKHEGIWKVVHVHKSPAWQAPHIQI
jgi:hypothetical protein